MINSPLRYPGGKSRAVNFLAHYIPLQMKEFREPFFGGGSIGFYVKQYRKANKLTANDLNYELYCFWTSVRNNIEQLCEDITIIKQTYSNGKQLYREILERRNDDLSELQRGIDFFLLNRISFSGVVDSGGYSEGAFQKRFTVSSIERLKKSHDVVNNFKFFAYSFEEIIKADGKDVFIFLDPPYHSATKSKLYGKKGVLHTGFDHLSLLSALKDTKHKFLMTYDNSDFIRDLYKDFYTLEWDLQYGMNNYKQNNAGIGKELLISNHPLRTNDLLEHDPQKYPSRTLCN